MSSPNTNDKPQPPVPFADFEFSFDPGLHPLFPAFPSVPSSASLFSQSETTDLFGFLDNFTWEFDPEPPHTNTNTTTTPNLLSPPIQYTPSLHHHHGSVSPHPGPLPLDQPLTNHKPPSSPIGSITISPHSPPQSPTALASRPPKTLLSQPQKRLNHIMSEQKRRNAIRDGYAQLTTLLAPAGSARITMPTRGRPKGSGNRGKGHGKGKSGILFRAVEYCNFLEVSRAALFAEVQRLEAIAGLPSN